MASSSEVSKLHFMIFPLMAHGHTIPTLDMAKLFAIKGAKSTIVTTPINSKLFEKPIKSFNHENPNLEDITVEILNFPCVDLFPNEGCETNAHMYSSPVLSKDPPMVSMTYLEEQLEQLLETTKPDCLVGNRFFPWAIKVAEKFGVPRLEFHGRGYFPSWASYSIRVQKPHKEVNPRFEIYGIPNIPGDLNYTDVVGTEGHVNDVVEEVEVSVMGKLLNEMKESQNNSFGVLLNSFYELEPAYSDFYMSFVAERTWCIGPISLINRVFEEKAGRGKKASIDEHETLKWLDSKSSDSVIYVSLGSMTKFNEEQVIEIASGLEMSGHDFVWVVNKSGSQEEMEEWLPEGFEERTKAKGLIIRRWAPEVLILDHKAIGGFVTHCEWNSLLEGLASGLPMVTWPVEAEQLYNEKLVTQVLKTGVSVGVKNMMYDFISRETVESVIREVMVGEERRERAKELAEMAKGAVKEGGSSDLELNRLMEDLMLVKLQNQKK